MAKTIVGLDISAGSLRAVELSDATRARPTLVRHHQMSLPEGAVDRGEVVEPRTVATALKQLWSAAGFTTKDVVLGIGNHRVLARDLTVPKASLKHIRESLPFQVQDMLPFPAEDALLDFYPISEDTSETGPVIHGLLVAALKEAVLGNVAAIQLAGLNPVDVDLVPFALSRVLLRGEAANGMTAVIDVGASTTTVIVSSHGAPQFVRIIPTGGDDLTQGLSTRLNITMEQADALKRTIGISVTEGNADQKAAIKVMFDVTQELITSLRNTLSYFAGTRPNDGVTRIVLTGEGSKLRGFADALAEYTRTEVSIGDPLGDIGVSRKVDRESLDKQTSSLAVALGLALGSAA
jgi:type IV pilus assembly protein PilM